MNVAEALKLLSSFFTTGNLYFQLQENYLNHKSVSLNAQWLYYRLIPDTRDFFILKCFDSCDSLNAALPIFEQRFNVSQFVRSLHLSQLEASSDDSVASKTHYQYVCDDMLAASDLFGSGFYYFINVDYDYKNKIWKSLGFET